ncbi:T9SS type A sorting domain-containing protein [bacterium]|nr:T9SS type A sorting domain-containing protein [bacterium]
MSSTALNFGTLDYSVFTVLDPSSVSDDSNVPKEFSLKQNYPNPFNPTTTISYDLKNETFVKLNVYDVKGKLVKILVNKVENASSHSVVWDGTDNSGKSVSNGIYFCKMEANDFTQTQKMILLK